MNDLKKALHQQQDDEIVARYSFGLNGEDFGEGPYVIGYMYMCVELPTLCCGREDFGEGPYDDMSCCQW